MIARKFIRLNFDGDVFFITDIRRAKFTISEKEFDSGELDEMCFVCNKTGRMYSIFTINRNYVYDFAHKVSVHFLYCMNYSKKLFKYHEKNIRKFCKKKKSVIVYSSEHKVELIFLEEGLSIGNAFHVCYQDVNLLDLDFMFRLMEEAVDVFENENPRALESGYALFIRYDNAPESNWEFLGYTPPKTDNQK